jgi:hypothetical protein
MPINVNGHIVTSKEVKEYQYNSIIKDGLVLQLEAPILGTTGGTTWYDFSGNGNNGTLINGPTYSSTDNGVVVFDGSNDNVDVSNASSLNFTSQLTLSSWFWFNSLPSSELGLFRKNQQWQLGLFNSNTVRCLVYTNGTTGWTAANDVSYTFATNTWYNMVMTYNGSNMLIYVNNSLIKTATVTGSIVANTNKVQVGYHTSVLNGNISKCMIYNRALSSTEILHNYNVVKSRLGL